MSSNNNSNTLEFVAEAVIKKSFWKLVLTSVTIVLMTAWRSQTKDEIYWDAAVTVGKKKWY